MLYQLGLLLQMFSSGTEIRTLFHRGKARWAIGLRCNILSQGNEVGYLLAILLTMTGLTTALGVTPVFGALMAGIVTSQAMEEPERPRA